jgi:hypothetical protein
MEQSAIPLEFPARKQKTFAAWLALGGGVAAILLLASLHLLSPEFDPSWRAVSEYALGNSGWVLTLMFLAWGVGMLSAAYLAWPQVPSRWGKFGVICLAIAGIGATMGGLFDVTHPLHGTALMLGSLTGLGVLVTSLSLSRAPAWSSVRRPLLWTAHLTWISEVLFFVTLFTFMAALTQAGADMSVQPIQELPAGVSTIFGYANRLFVVAPCAWLITVGWLALKLHRSEE